MANHLTTRTIEALKPGAARREVPDGAIGGLYLVVQPSGAKSWAYRYRFAGRAAKLTLGGFPLLDPKAARLLAGEAGVALARGIDPAKAKRDRNRAAEPVRDTFEIVVLEYVERYAKLQTRERSWREVERLLTRETAAWRGRRLSDLRRADVARLLDRISERARVMANRLLTPLQRMGVWAVERGLIDASPFAAIRPPTKETARERVLTAPEIAAAWRAFGDGGVIGDAAKVLLLTGQRLREVAEMEWSEIDFAAQVWTIPAARSKNGAAHELPLSDAVLAIFAERKAASPACRFVFSANGRTAVSGFSKAKKRFDAAIAAEIGAPVTGWRIHDLRRTAATGLAALGVAPHVVEACLNHRGGAIAGVARVYNRHPYSSEKRAALDAWGDALATITVPAAEAAPLALAA